MKTISIIGFLVLISSYINEENIVNNVSSMINNDKLAHLESCHNVPNCSIKPTSTDKPKDKTVLTSSFETEPVVHS
jgi:hypothetical protein